MPLYRMFRRVIFDTREQAYREAYGIDRTPANLPTKPAPRDTDKDDPIQGLRSATGACSPMLVLQDGSWVTWHKMFEFLSEAEDAGYTLISGFEKLSPYSTMILRGD
jgi:hypothetical protein